MVSSNILLMRHAEKPIEALREKAFDCQSQKDSRSLSERGWERARKLPQLFAPAGSAASHLPVPDRIFASAFRPGGGHSRRPEETVRPLSDQLRRPVDLNWALHQEKAFGAVLARLQGTSLV